MQTATTNLSAMTQSMTQTAAVVLVTSDCGTDVSRKPNGSALTVAALVGRRAR
jgi:hypothetical protein